MFCVTLWPVPEKLISDTQNIFCLMFYTPVAAHSLIYFYLISPKCQIFSSKSLLNVRICRSVCAVNKILNWIKLKLCENVTGDYLKSLKVDLGQDLINLKRTENIMSIEFNLSHLVFYQRFTKVFYSRCRSRTQTVT